MSVTVPNQTVAITRNDLPTPDFRRWQLAITDAVNTSADSTPIEPVSGDFLPLSTYVKGVDGLAFYGSLATGGVSLGLETLADTATGTFKLIDERDSFGRITGVADGTAADVPYDNATSGLAADDVQAAIDELSAEKLDDAPSDGTTYGRKDGAWAGIATGGGTDLSITAQFYDECYGNAVTQAGWVADLATGTIIVQDSVVGLNGTYKLNSGGTSGNRAGIIHGGFNVDIGGGEIRSLFRVRPQLTPGGSQQSQYVVGMKAGTATVDAGDLIQVRADDTSGGWLLQWGCAAGIPTSGVSVIPGTITGGTTQEIEIRISASGLSVSFYLDGTLVDTLTLPAGFTRLKPFIRSRKNGASGVSSALWVDKVLVEQDR